MKALANMRFSPSFPKNLYVYIILCVRAACEFQFFFPWASCGRADAGIMPGWKYNGVKVQGLIDSAQPRE